MSNDKPQYATVNNNEVVEQIYIWCIPDACNAHGFARLPKKPVQLHENAKFLPKNRERTFCRNNNSAVILKMELFNRIKSLDTWFNVINVKLLNLKSFKLSRLMAIE